MTLEHPLVMPLLDKAAGKHHDALNLFLLLLPFFKSSCNYIPPLHVNFHLLSSIVCVVFSPLYSNPPTNCGTWLSLPDPGCTGGFCLLKGSSSFPL